MLLSSLHINTAPPARGYLEFVSVTECYSHYCTLRLAQGYLEYVSATKLYFHDATLRLATKCFLPSSPAGY